MANRVHTRKATVEVHQFERGSQGAINRVGEITSTVYVAKTSMPVWRGMCTSRFVEAVEFFFICYAGARIEVTPPNVSTASADWGQTPTWQHGWKVELPGEFEHPLKEVKARAEDAARRLGKAA